MADTNKSVSLAIRVTPETYRTLQRAQALLPCMNSTRRDWKRRPTQLRVFSARVV